MITLVCPYCQSTLEKHNIIYKCTSCNMEFHSQDNIPLFTEALDPFYEGKFSATITDSNNIKDRTRRLVLRRIRFLQDNLNRLSKKGSLKILDIACGGGHELLKRYGHVIGVDISLASLQQAHSIYDQVICADAAYLPFASETFDVVVAMDFLGHIPFEKKNKILQEIRRILKPGGSTLQYIETQGNNSMQNLALKHPALYEKHFIQPEGHVGLEAPMTVLERFYSVGLLPVQHQGAYKTWVKPPAEITNRLGTDYSKIYPLLRLPVLVDKSIIKYPIIRLIGTAFTEIVSQQLDRFLPLKMSDGLFLKAIRT